MSTAALPLRRDPLRPAEHPMLGRGFAFAIVAHAALVLALSYSVNWRTRELPTFEAELWSAVPQAAAPREEAPPAPPPREVKQEVKAPPKPPGPTPEELQQARDAEIAVAKAREKKRKEEELRQAELEAERKKQLAQKEKELKLEKERLERLEKQEKLEKEKRLAEEKKKLQAEKDKQIDKAAEKAVEKAAEARREALRQEQLRRIQGMAGASGGPSATGTAQQSSGPSASYGGRIKARIRPNIIYSDTAPGNPVAEVEVRVAPDGTIVGKKLVKPSGNAEWDQAVLRAIDKTETLPRDTDGRVPSLIVISFQPRE